MSFSQRDRCGACTEIIIYDSGIEADNTVRILVVIHIIFEEPFTQRIDKE